MTAYKIFRQDEWLAFDAAGETAGAPIDLEDGYIHLSTAEQVAETAAKYFAGVDGLMLLAVEADFTWEASRGGALFPHLYRKLRRDDVLWAKPLPIRDGAHDFTGLL